MTPVANFDSMGCLKLGGHISGVPEGADILGEPDIHAQHEVCFEIKFRFEFHIFGGDIFKNYF